MRDFRGPHYSLRCVVKVDVTVGTEMLLKNMQNDQGPSLFEALAILDLSPRLSVMSSIAPFFICDIMHAFYAVETHLRPGISTRGSNNTCSIHNCKRSSPCEDAYAIP